MDNVSLGKKGEQIAAGFLKESGFILLEQNFRAKRYGEVDLIALSPDKKSCVFVEVKTRSGDRFGSPEEAVGWHKLRELRKMVDYYYALHPALALTPRIDVVAIQLDTDQQVLSLKHFENVTML